jgi:glycine cleavage system H protein
MTDGAFSKASKALLRAASMGYPFACGGALSRAWRKGPTPAMHVRYTQDHQYLIVEDGVGTVGITAPARRRAGAERRRGRRCRICHGASDLFSPVSGEILGGNEPLTGKPELVNEEAEGAGWLYKVKLNEPSELDTLWIGKLISLTCGSKVEVPLAKLRRLYAI